MASRPSTSRPSRPSKVRFGGSYHDRIPLEEDFETVSVRTASLSGPNSFPMTTDRSSVSSSWTFGDSWAPEDSQEFSLDPDQGWYDEAVDADIGDVMEGLEIPPRRRNRSQASVCTRSGWYTSFIALIVLQARPHVFWKNNARDKYLDELLRHEGRGDFAHETRCPDCVSRGVEEPARAEYRCRSCFLPDLTCRLCFIRRHRMNPFHTVEVRISLTSIFFVY